MVNKRSFLYTLFLFVVFMNAVCQAADIPLHDKTSDIFFIEPLKLLILYTNGECEQLTLDTTGYVTNRHTVLTSVKAVSAQGSSKFCILSDKGDLNEYDAHTERNGKRTSIGEYRHKTVSLAVGPSGIDRFVGLNNGLVMILDRSTTHDDVIKLSFLTHEKSVYALSCNSNEAYLLTASIDGTIKIWETETGMFGFISRYTMHTEYKAAPPLFSPTDTTLFAYSPAPDTVTLQYVAGSSRTITVGSKITAMTFTPDGKHLVIADMDGSIQLYSVTAGEKVYDLNTLVSAPITGVTAENKRLAVSFDNKTMRLYTIPDDFIQPAVTELPASSSTEASSDTLKDPSIGGSITRVRDYDAVEIGTNFCTYTANPYYVGALTVHAGYFFYRWLAPFYFGAEAACGFGFPSKKFPRDYYLGGTKLHSPYSVDLTLSAPIGFYFLPFNNDLAFQTQISVGLQLKRLWNGSAKSSIHTAFFPAFASDLTLAIQYKYAAFSVGVHYDSIFKFGVLVGIRGIIPIYFHKKEQNK